ncbi:MAG: hypothetical protein N2050_02460 [Flavobacteriales bacterium]|nr:hypothetical protein [Flavobacteriales bacterium]
MIKQFLTGVWRGANTFEHTQLTRQDEVIRFLFDTFEKLNGKRVGLLRADSGFYDKKVFEYLKRKNIHCIIAARPHAPIQQMLATHKT